MIRQQKTALYCFSPPVMLATFAIELCLALYTLWRYRLSRVTRLAMLLLGCLAIFQLAEYMVCGGLGMSAIDWARIGYGSITMLPPIGIHLAYVISGRQDRAVVATVYALGIGFVGYFLFASDVFSGNQCLGNYVIFQLGTVAAKLYTLYYYGLLVWGVALSYQLGKRAKPRVRRALYAFIAGYVFFMLPTTIVNTIDPSTIAGIPSIMCGFAVALALVVVGFVLPLTADKK